MSSPEILSILELLNNSGYKINVEDKIASETIKYDGISLATKFCTIGDKIIELDDHYFVHEIGHWLFANPSQRFLPNFGLVCPKIYKEYRDIILNHYVILNMNEYDPNYQPTRYEIGQSLLQEILTQKFSLHCSKLFNIKAQFYKNETKLLNWKYYEYIFLDMCFEGQKFNITKSNIDNRFQEILSTIKFPTIDD